MNVNSDPQLLPSYTQPKSVYTILPGTYHTQHTHIMPSLLAGGLHYLHVEKPTLGERLDTLMRHTNYVCDDHMTCARVHVIVT